MIGDVFLVLSVTSQTALTLLFAAGGVYTGLLWTDFSTRSGALPYRALDMQFERLIRTRSSLLGTVSTPPVRTFTHAERFRAMTGQVLPW